MDMIDYETHYQYRHKARYQFEQALRTLDVYLDHGDWGAVERALELACDAVRACRKAAFDKTEDYLDLADALDAEAATYEATIHEIGHATVRSLLLTAGAALRGAAAALNE